MKSSWIVVVLVVAVLFGAITGAGLLMQAAAQAPAVAVDVAPGWQYSGGYWNYWDPGDKAWYYTDGRGWYTYGANNTWSPYAFDRSFGKAYVREGYVVPKPGPGVVLPSHQIKVKVR
jgi:hypothetical protein